MVVLDTHVLIWMILDSKRLSKNARESIQHSRGASGIVIADVTLWELAWLIEHQRISVSSSLERFVEEAASLVMVHPVTPEIAALAVRLPAAFPRDPTDRLIASTAVSLGVPLVTADERIRQAQVVSTIW